MNFKYWRKQNLQGITEELGDKRHIVHQKSQVKQPEIESVPMHCEASERQPEVRQSLGFPITRSLLLSNVTIRYILFRRNIFFFTTLIFLYFFFLF
jgi:hypothetical protein